MKLQTNKATKKEDLSIHARSVLLQGLLCSSKKDQWKTTGIDNFEEILKFLNEKYKEYNKTSISDLCISYAISQDWIDSVVIGVLTTENLCSNLKSISMPFMHEKNLSDIRHNRPKVKDIALDPSKWN